MPAFPRVHRTLIDPMGERMREKKFAPRKHVFDVVGWSQLMDRCSRISSFLGAITNAEHLRIRNITANDTTQKW